MNLKTHKLWYFILLIGLTTFSWLSLALAATDCAIQTQIDEEECQVLVDLYTSTNGDNWTDGNWNVTNTPCSWEGVRCYNGHVTRLELDWDQLSGPIPESLGKLRHLFKLHLIDTQLSGPIPESLGNLSNLRELILRKNQLNGSIPESLSKLTNLRIIYLNNNQLSGKIPKSLGKLRKLKYLK